MAKTPAPTGLKGALANIDQGDKVKLLLASIVLALALVWILFYAFGSSDKPNVSQADIVKAEAEFTAEKEQQPKPRIILDKQGRPPPPPVGS